ncbi:APH1 [Oopsacas minuta]|uniref:APH1 n=1 Tax=Oopsacas minuta TaxID=111878 RepID=A0A2I5KCE0_9METZ|nr:APH1 [Oopsacas minuta]KAI6653753.1 APH1 [Oopsacas minuta]
MTVFSCVSYALIAYGPATALILVTQYRYAEQVLIMLVCGFIWLISLFLSSLIWTAVPPLRNIPAFTLPFSVILQELARCITFIITKKLSNKFSNPDTRYRHQLAYSAGAGFGVASGLFMFLNVLKSSLGPGVVGLRGSWSYPQFILTSALLTCAFTLLHIPWSVILFDACYRRKWFLLFITPISHLILSSLTLLNSSITVWPSLLAAYVLLLVLTVLAFKTAGGNFINTTKICSKKLPRDSPSIQ